MQSIVLNAGVVVLVDALVFLRVGLDEILLVEVLVVLLLWVVVAELGGGTNCCLFMGSLCMPGPLFQTKTATIRGLLDFATTARFTHPRLSPSFLLLF